MNERITEIILSLLAVLIILTVHEYSHGLVAYKLGDSTAKDQGRLTLNPLKHIDPFGALCLVFFHFGWAKPVPVNLRNFQKPKRDFALVAIAGPLSNLIMAFISSFLFLLSLALVRDVAFTNRFVFNLVDNLIRFIYIFFITNVGLAIFNLIPLPPLDGSRILGLVLTPKAYYNYLKHERIIYYILLGWLLIGDFAASILLKLPIVGSSLPIRILASVISLSDLLGYALNFVSDLMLSFWELIPFLKL